MRRSAPSSVIFYGIDHGEAKLQSQSQIYDLPMRLVCPRREPGCRDCEAIEQMLG